MANRNEEGWRLYGATVRSPVPRGRLRAVELDPKLDWSDVTVVSANDLDVNVVSVTARDQPILVKEVINHAYEPVVLLACADRAKLERAKAAVHLEIDESPAVLDMHDAVTNRLVVWTAPDGFGETDTNVMKRVVSASGDAAASEAEIDAEIAKCARVVKGTYSTHHRQRGVHVGGDDLHAALLEKKSGRPVRMIHDLAEDMQAGPKLHPSYCEITTGCDADGTLRALKVSLLLDAGAYLTLTLDALSRSVSCAAGGYRWPVVRIEATAVATNTPPNGAFRGSGAEQAVWAIERHLDAVAAELGVDPMALKRQNLVAADAIHSFDQVVSAAKYFERRKAIDEENRRRASRGERTRLGIGGSVSQTGAGVAEVEVDLDTFEVDVKTFVLAADAAGPTLAGIGWALSEDVVWKNGLVRNPSLESYVLPTALDAPRFSTLSERRADDASGAPTIAAAVEHATGISVDHLPLTPERLLEASLGRSLFGSGLVSDEPRAS